MNSIEHQAIQTYQENLNYFETKHPELYQKLSTLEHAISNGVYTEKYVLEYKEEGYFDIQELASGAFLYNENSIDYSQRLSDTIDLKRSGSVFEAQQRFPLQEHELEEIEEFKNFHSSLWATARILHYNSLVAPKNNSEMKKLHKLIFLETALGIHINNLIAKYKPQVVFIKEDNLEIFRLSLFVTNYAAMLQETTAHFSIMQNFTQLQYTFTSFLNQLFNHNLYIKFLPFSKQHENDLNELQSITLSQNHIMYPYQAFMKRNFSVIEKITKDRCFFDISHSYTQTPLSSKPLLVLASGPSLQNNTDWIVKNQEKFIIVAVLSACKHLFHHNIKPDIVMHIDPQEAAVEWLLDGLDMSDFDTATLIFGSSVPEVFIEQFGREDVIIVEEATELKVGYGFFTLPSIGEYASLLPFIIGAKDVYLLGVDLALDPETMKGHIDLHVSSKKELDLEKKLQSVDFQGSICYVKGNFLEAVPSKPNFRHSLTHYVDAIRRYKHSSQNLYNLSNGAYLEGSTPLHINDIDLEVFSKQDKRAFQQELKLFLSQNSSCELRDLDKRGIQKQLKIALEILQKVKKLRKLKPKNSQEYLEKKLLPFAQEIAEMNQKEKTNLGEIFFEYFKITLSFIFDTLNTQDNREVKTHLKNVDKIVLDYVEKIAQTYYKKVTGYLKKEE